MHELELFPIMGANVGTTITAQIIAFKVTKYPLGLVAVGFGVMFLSKRKEHQHYGAMIMGLGMIFLGMGFMSEATNPLPSYEPFIEMMQQMSNPLLGILVAAAFTALVQSSSATTGIVIVLASQGFITLAFGANIGTCVTAAFAAIGKAREASQAAAVHFLFNVLGVLIWLPFIGRERLALGVNFSAETIDQGRSLSNKVREAFDLAVRSLEEPELARDVIAMKSEVQDLVSGMGQHLAGRLGADAPDRTVLYRLESQAVEFMQREYYFAKKVAKEVVREIEASIEDPVMEDELAESAARA